MTEIRISTIDEVPLEASKWLKSPILIDGQEMAQLFESLGEFYLYQVGAVVKRGEGEISPDFFLQQYAGYVSQLEAGQVPDPKSYRHLFSCVMTRTKEAVYAIILEGDKQLIRVSKPIVQLQAHHIGYSTVDGKFRSMVFGSDSISWGIQFSYPQLFQDGVTKEVGATRLAEGYPNTELYHSLQKWVRHHTIPTPFSVDGELTNVPVRLGKQCLPWINRHPQLISKGISVESSRTG